MTALAAELAAATALLTRLPVRASADRAGGAAFGLVGAGLGLVAAVPLVLLGSVAPLAGGALAVGVLALASGTLHLDGLADTADALAAPTPDAADRARRDPRSGPAGISALTIAIVLQAALLAALAERAALELVLAVVVAASASRAAATLAVLAGAPVRDGFGGWFMTRTSRGQALLGAGMPLAIAVGGALVLDRPALLAVGLAGLAAGAALGLVLARMRAGLDGDALGAVVEGAFAAGLLAAVLAG